MKISDEIREWCDDAYSGRKIRTTKDLYVIADLIDRDMVELPKDAQMAYIEAEREVDRLQTENAKLRELVADLWEYIYIGTAQDGQSLHDRTRELGVEVDG